MSADVISSVGTVVSVSATIPTTPNQAGYDALTFTTISLVSAVPDIGAEQAVNEFVPISTGVPIKRPGAVSLPDFTLTIALTASDAGEAILRTKANAAVTDQKLVAIRVVLPNSDVIYFQATVRGFTYQIGDSNAITQAVIPMSMTTHIPLYKTV